MGFTHWKNGVFMKYLFSRRIRGIFGIIVLIAIIILLSGACRTGTSPEPGIGRITITGIPAIYDGKFAMLLVDSNNITQAWGMITISGTSTTFNLLEMINDISTTINPGNYNVSILISESLTAVTEEDFIYIGILLGKALQGETASIAFNEFISP